MKSQWEIHYWINSIKTKKIKKQNTGNEKECCKKIKKLFNLKFKKLFCFLFFSVQSTKNTDLCLYFERAKINHVFFFLFKIFLEIFKDMKNGSLVYILGGQKKNRQEKYITSTMESILLSLNKTKHY